MYCYITSKCELFSIHIFFFTARMACESKQMPMNKWKENMMKLSTMKWNNIFFRADGGGWMEKVNEMMCDCIKTFPLNLQILPIFQWHAIHALKMLSMAKRTVKHFSHLHNVVLSQSAQHWLLKATEMKAENPIRMQRWSRIIHHLQSAQVDLYIYLLSVEDISDVKTYHKLVWRTYIQKRTNGTHENIQYITKPYTQSHTIYHSGPEKTRRRKKRSESIKSM